MARSTEKKKNRENEEIEIHFYFYLSVFVYARTSTPLDKQRNELTAPLHNSNSTLLLLAVSFSGTEDDL